MPLSLQIRPSILVGVPASLMDYRPTPKIWAHSPLYMSKTVGISKIFLAFPCVIKVVFGIQSVWYSDLWVYLWVKLINRIQFVKYLSLIYKNGTKNKTYVSAKNVVIMLVEAKYFWIEFVQRHIPFKASKTVIRQSAAIRADNTASCFSTISFTIILLNSH